MSTSRPRARKTVPRTPRHPRTERGKTSALRSYFNELFETASDIILINDRAGRIVAANRAAREFGGYTGDDVERGVSLREVLPSPDYEAAMVLTERALDDLPVPEVYERTAVLRDGSHHVLELRSNALRQPGQPPLLQTIGRDVTEQREAAAFQSSMLQVSQALLTAQRLDELGQVICEAASSVLRLDGAYLWLHRDNELIGCAATGVAAAQFLTWHLPVNDSLIGQIYRAADVLVVNDFQHSLYNQGDAGRFGVQAMLAVPLRRSGSPVGVLVFTDNTNSRRFSATLRERALIFGAQTTVAIESALAREREEEEGRISAALFQVSRTIRESLEESDVLRQVASGAREAVQCDWAFVALRDADSGTMRLAAMEGFPTRAAEELQVLGFDPSTIGELRGLVAHQTVEMREPPAERSEIYARWSVGSFLSVPMVRANRLIGAFSVGFAKRRGPFSPRERRIAEGIANQAAVAVENARLVQNLRAANQLKSEFLGTMSHELRTPLNAILGYSELMQDGEMGAVSSEQVEVLERIQQNGRGLLELINMTLDVNRLEAGRIAMTVTEFSLDKLIAELRDEFGVREIQQTVTLSWPDNADVSLQTDHGKLRAVLRNLIDNALKFTRQGSVQVTASHDADDDRVALAVRDTGAGIPSGAIPSIFEMFRQLDRTATLSRSGVGLGLYLVRRYTDLLGGKISVESTVGEGSTFTVDIPRRLGGQRQG